MSETAGGAHDYQPRHAAPQLDDHLVEFLASSADEYRYAQMGKQYDAEYAIERARLLSSGDVDVGFIGDQQLLIAKSLGRQAAAETYAEELRSQLYYAPQDGKYYHGRHRLEDRPVPSDSEEGRHRREPSEQDAAPERVLMPALIFESMVRAPDQPESPPGPSPPQEASPVEEPVEPPPHYQVPASGRLAHIIDEEPELPPEPPPVDEDPESPPKPPSWEPPSPSHPFRVIPQREDGYFPERPRPSTPPPDDIRPGQQPQNVAPSQRERRGVLGWLRHAWYAGGAAIGAYFYHPEKGRRRRVVARVATVVGVVGLVLWLNPEFGDRSPEMPDGAQPPAPPPNTRQHFDNLQPANYEGQHYEWGAAADDYGAKSASPQVLSMIQDARATPGVQVDTWGNPASGHWGINDITVNFDDGSQKTYYDTRHKWAILQHLSKLRRSSADDEHESYA